jgi:PAS domain S-box-containing protein
MLMQRLHPQDRVFFQQIVNSAFQSGTDFELEYRLLSADGRVKHVHTIAHASRDASGNRAYIGAVSDITERKMPEENIRRNETDLRTLIDVMPAFVGTAAPDGSIEFINQSFLEDTGFYREQGMGWGWVSTVHPEDHDRVVATWRAGLAAGEPIKHELRCRRADGTYHWFLCRGHPLRDDAENVVKWYVTLTNIDKLKGTESALKAREHNLLGVIAPLQWSGQFHRPVKSVMRIKKFLSIVGLRSTDSRITIGLASFIPMIGRRLRRHSLEQSTLERRTG